MSSTSVQIAHEIIAGKRLKQHDDLSFLIEGELESLCEGADLIRQAFIGDRVDLCSIINAKSGRCSENCKYCAQSVYNHSQCEVYELLPVDKLLEACQLNERERVDRFSLVTSGYSLQGQEFDRAIEAYEKMRDQCKIDLCASMGFLTRDQLQRLYNAGVTTYHHNIETAPQYFSKICTTHTIEQKLATLKMVKAVGMRVCSGGILGMGESWKDRVEMALTLAEYDVDSVPLNFLIPIPGTPLEKSPLLTENEILRIVAIFRYIVPTARIRLAGGRGLLPNSGERAFCSGADSAITGNMLTTIGCATIKTDRKMLQNLGRIVLK